MCGIAGFLSPKMVGKAPLISETVREMTSRIRHRGPDGEGSWVDADHGLGFGHARLSILDLSDAGKQPMASSCGRMMLTFNGEIYNATEIRQELQKRGRNFKGHSDTEVLVEACAEFGLVTAVKKCIGMFAFALWDRKHKKLCLVRDRLGKKPLYYSQSNGELVFGSELSAFYPFKPWKRNIDPGSLASFLVFGYVADPHSIYEGISKVPPGHMASFDLSGGLQVEPYWALEDFVPARGELPCSRQLTDTEAITQARQLVKDSVASRLVADVPVGIFLSGGLDSTTVAAVASGILGPEQTQTFSIGFQEQAFNESEDARLIANHLGTRHHELVVTADDALDCIPQLASIYDEPFADSSQIPTYLLSKLARENITVALSGDGGDEAFGGYNRYLHAARLSAFSSPIPKFARSALSSLMQLPSPAMWDRIFGVLPASMQIKNAGDKLHKLATIVPLDEVGIYRQLLSQWPDAFQIVEQADDPFHVFMMAQNGRERIDSYFRWMQYLDSLHYLPNDILTKVDRASMAVSLEVRCPLLDHRIIEFCWSLKDDQLIRKGKMKWLLRQLVSDYVPSSLSDRPKMGFGIPLAEWLRGPLRSWCEDLLQRSTLLSSGLIDPDQILVKWEEHKSGARNWQYALWNVLMFQSWWLASPDRSIPYK